MTEAPSTAELIDAIREGALFSEGSRVEGTERIELMASILEGNTREDFVTVMDAPSVATPLEYAGIEGFKEALSDWISPYAKFRLEVDEVIVHGDQMVHLVRQVASTKHDGVELETPSAIVWSLAGDKLRRVTFYLDQQAGLEAAGIDPKSR